MTRHFTHTAIVSVFLLPLVVNAQTQELEGEEMADAAPQDTAVVIDNSLASAARPHDISEEALLSEFARYRILIQQGTLDEADIAAKRIVEMAINVYGPQTRETANALNNLGIVQHRSGQYDAAIQNFMSSVEIVELVADRLNDALVNPLKGLGAAQLENGRPDLAKKTFTRAAHITQVNEGPHNRDQIEILESIAETDIRLGDTKAARNILDRIHIINVKHFEQNPLGLLPSLMTRAHWHHRAGYYGEERTTYRRAIRIIESSSGKKDRRLIEPLRRLGASFYFVDISMTTPQQQGLVSTGEMYFKRASRIAEKSEDVGWYELAETRLALADYYTYIDSQNRSRRIYKEIWGLLSADEERLAQRTAWFENPVAIRTEPLPPSATSADANRSHRDTVLTGQIVVRYDVSSHGRVRNMRTEAFPEEFTNMQRVVHREIRRRVYRPRLVEGTPVSAENLRLEHNFSYLKSDLDALLEAKAQNAKEQ